MTTTTDPSPSTDDVDGSPPELELATRLLDLIKYKFELEQVATQARKDLEAAETKVAEAEAEIVALKRTLGKSARGKRGSRPTRAGTSGGAKTADVLAVFAKDRKWRTTAEVRAELGMEGSKALSGLLARLTKQGQLERAETGRTAKTGWPIYKFRRPPSR